MNELTLVTAFTLGLLGSGHCLGMCCGLSGVLGLAEQQGNSRLLRLISYNSGRIATYGMIGVAAGLLGAGLLEQAPQLGLWLRTIAGLLLVAMGLYLAGWWMGLTRLELIGGLLWRRVQPLTRRLIPVRNSGQALQLGLLWGLLPCGLVYSTLGWALAAADWRQSGLLMLAFGAGTLPAMLATGLASQQFLQRLRQPKTRAIAGLLVIAMGFATLWPAWAHRNHSAEHGGMDHSQHQPADAILDAIDKPPAEDHSGHDMHRH